MNHKKFKKIEKTYNIITQFGSEDQIDTLIKIKDKIANLRTNMEHYNKEFYTLSPKSLEDWKKKLEETVEKLYNATKTINKIKTEFNTITTIIQRLLELISTQLIASIIEKLKDFLTNMKDVSEAIKNVEYQILDIEKHFYNLLPARNLEIGINHIMTGIRTIFVILRENVLKYINIEETKIKKIQNNDL